MIKEKYILTDVKSGFNAQGVAIEMDIGVCTYYKKKIFPEKVDGSTIQNALMH